MSNTCLNCVEGPHLDTTDGNERGDYICPVCHSTFYDYELDAAETA